MNYWTHPTQALRSASTFAAIAFGQGLRDWRNYRMIAHKMTHGSGALYHSRVLLSHVFLREALIGLPRFEQREMGQLIAEQLKAKMKINI